MPLHLLGKKSWNVYNADNIARVRRDEAAAADREAAEEQRMQEEDAARRLAILRGEEPLPLTSAGIDTSAHDEPDNARPRRGLVPERCRRKRKRPDEDDTEFEMRVVRENAESNAVASHGLLDGHRSGSTPKGEKSALTDVTGLFSLFDDGVFEKSAPRNSMKKEEAEEGVAKKTREAEDQYQMLFANAAGRDGAGITDGGPWYAKRIQGNPDMEVSKTNVWGRADPKRKDRALSRLAASDPLAIMKSGAAKVRQVNSERHREAEERERALHEMRREDRRRRHGKRRHHDPLSDLEGFSLDMPSNGRVGHTRERENQDSRQDARSHRDHTSGQDGHRRRHHRHHDEGSRQRHLDRL